MDQQYKRSKTIEESLAHIPFFSSLSPPTLSAISAKLKSIHFQYGQVVFVENSPADAMYLIESGQVKVSITTDQAGSQEKVINYLGPGNFFGEMALILDQPRSATVTVTIDADLWVLYKADMDDLLVENPEIALPLTRELSRRLSDVVTDVKKRPGYHLAAVFGDRAWILAEQIYQLTRQRVALFDLTGRNLARQAGPDFQNEKLVILKPDPETAGGVSLIETVGILADGYDWVLIALPSIYNDTHARVLQLAQATVLLSMAAEAWITMTTKGPIFPCDITNAAAVGRTARKITQRVVGLALSSGGARGIAHIGVLQALEAANVPIDIIAGTSAGSLFGGLYACGRSIDEIVDFARNLPHLIEFKSGLWDPKFSLPWNGLIKGNATLRYLSKQFNEATFANTQIPFYVVAADVLSGEEVVFEVGSVAEAVRASIGIIGIFSPYQYDGRYLIDGGAVNPVPATVLADKGANIIIASNVIPTLEEERARGQAAAKRGKNLNFLGVLSSMMGIMEREIVKTRMYPVDVLIRPAVEVYTAMEYDKVEHFIKLGQAAVERELPLIKQKLFIDQGDPVNRKQ